MIEVAVVCIGVIVFARMAFPYGYIAFMLWRAKRLIRQEQRLEEALRMMEQVLAQQPDHALAYVLRSQVLYKLGADTEALADADQAIRLAPRSYRGYMLRALLHDYFGEYHNAIRDLQSALFYNPRWLVGYLDLALHYLALGEPERSLRVLLALSLRAEGHSLHYNALVMSGLVYEENFNDFDAAIQSYSRAIEVAPERRVAYLMRGWALRAQGDYRAAAEDLLQASACTQPPEDEGLYDWIQAQYDPWLYLVAHDPRDRNAWLAALKRGVVAHAAPAPGPRISLN